MLASNLELLRHVQDEVAFILDATNGKDKVDVIEDPVLSRAIIRSLEIIGEAAKKKLTLNSKAGFLKLNGRKWQEQEIS